MNVKELLIEAKKLIEQPEHWTQGAYGRDKEGDEIETPEELNNAVLYDTVDVGKRRVIEEVICEIPDGIYNKEDTRKFVLNHFNEHYADLGWVLRDDGTASQQRGESHRYVLIKYVDEGSESDDKPEN